MKQKYFLRWCLEWAPACSKRCEHAQLPFLHYELGLLQTWEKSSHVFPAQAVFFNALLCFTEDFLFGLTFACGVILAFVETDGLLLFSVAVRGWTVVRSSRSWDTIFKVSFRGVVRSMMWAGRSMMSWWQCSKNTDLSFQHVCTNVTQCVPHTVLLFAHQTPRLRPVPATGMVLSRIVISHNFILCNNLLHPPSQGQYLRDGFNCFSVSDLTHRQHLQAPVIS